MFFPEKTNIRIRFLYPNTKRISSTCFYVLRALVNFDYEGLPIAKLEKKISHVRPMSLVILARALVSCRP